MLVKTHILSILEGSNQGITSDANHLNKKNKKM
jgi:hypothetical protein